MQLRGMTSAFADEVAAVRPRVTAVVARLVGDDAEDVVQEAVLRAFLSLSQLRERDRFENWLCGIALNVAKMQLRRAATEARMLEAAGFGVTYEEPEPLADVRDERPLTEHVHLAFPADADATVRDFHAAALAAGYEDHGAPGERAVYHPGYYGAFVLDPDGHNIEVVNHND